MFCCVWREGVEEEGRSVEEEGGRRWGEGGRGFCVMGKRMWERGSVGKRECGEEEGGVCSAMPGSKGRVWSKGGVWSKGRVWSEGRVGNEGRVGEGM